MQQCTEEKVVKRTGKQLVSKFSAVFVVVVVTFDDDKIEREEG